MTLHGATDTFTIVWKPDSRLSGFLLASGLTLAAAGCSIQKLAVNSLADALTSGTSVYTSDNDPELVGDALPFALKTFESLLEITPENEELLLATCQGFTQYAYAYIQIDLIQVELEDYRRYKEQKSRARNMYLRARDYCLRALELRKPGITGQLALDPEAAAREFGAGDVELLFWTGSSWGSAISVGVDRPELVADLPVAQALLHRCLELDPDFEQGTLQEAMVVLESLPETMGGSVERARQHYERALELNGGRRASTYVTWAELVSYAQQDRGEFEELLEKALAVDPDADKSQRLATLIAQKRARILLALVDDLFLDDVEDSEEE